MSPLTSATTDSGAVPSSGVTTTTTEAIIAAATSAEAAAAVAQEQGATLVTVHPAVIEAPVDVAEGQANEGEEVEGDGMCLDEYYKTFLRAASVQLSVMNVLSERFFNPNSRTRIFPPYCDFNAVHQETFSLIVPNM